MMRYEEVKMVRMGNIYDYMKKYHDAETAERVKQWFRVTFDCYHYNCAIYLDVEEEMREMQEIKDLLEEPYCRAGEYFYHYLSEVAGIGLNEKVMVLL